MHPFSLNDEQIEQISGAYLDATQYPGTIRFPSPIIITWGIGEDGTVPPHIYTDMN